MQSHIYEKNKENENEKRGEKVQVARVGVGQNLKNRVKDYRGGGGGLGKIVGLGTLCQLCKVWIINHIKHGILLNWEITDMAVT